MSLNRIPMQMITPRIVADIDPTTGGILLKFSDGSTKVVAVAGGGGGGGVVPAPTPTITVNGGQTANVQPSSNLAVRVQNVPAGNSITWAGTGSSTADPLISALQSSVGSSSGPDFTVNVPVGSASRTITFTASVGGSVVGSFTATVIASAVDFQLADLPALSFVAGSSTAQQLTAQLTNIVGAIGNVTVAFSVGSNPLTATPNSIQLSAGSPSGNTQVAITGAAAAGTYTLTATATNGTVTRTKTSTITVTSAAIQYQAPVLTFLTEAGMPTNEFSIGVTFGFRVENVYNGAGTELVLKGWNRGLGTPNGIDMDVTALIAQGSPYYNSTTKVFEFPLSAGLKFFHGDLEGSAMFNNAAGQTNRTISSSVQNIRMVNKAPDGQTRTSNTVNVTARRAITILGPLDATNNNISFVGGVAGSLNIQVYAPKFAGKKVGLFLSAIGYKGCTNMGTLTTSQLAFSMPYDAQFPDWVYSVSGSWNTCKFMTYPASDNDATTLGETLLGICNFFANPNGAQGGADVPPKLVFGKRNAALTIDNQWLLSNNSPMFQAAISGNFGTNGDANVRQDNNLVVARSTLGSSFKLKVSNLGMAYTGSASGSISTVISGWALLYPNEQTFNELTNTGSSATPTHCYWGANIASYNAQDQEFTFSTAQLDALWAASPFGDRTAFGMSVGGRDPEGFYHVFRHVSLTIIKG